MENLKAQSLVSMHVKQCEITYTGTVPVPRVEIEIEIKTEI